MSTDAAKERAARLLRKMGSQSTLASVEAPLPSGVAKPNTAFKHHSAASHRDDWPPNEAAAAARGASNVHCENTYRLGPVKRFPSAAITGILRDVLESYLKEEQYDPELCRQMAKTLTEVLKARVKDLRIPRYKVVAIVTIGQLKDQGIRVGSRCVWDAGVDCCSSYEFQNSSLFAVGNVYGIYTE